MTQTDSWTIGRLLEWTSDYLKQHGSDSSRLDAEVLLAFARNSDRISLYTEFEKEASDELRSSFRELVKKRAEGMPVAYLVGEKEFYSLPFHVTPDVLIPRPETEFAVVKLLDLAKEHFAGKSFTVVDIGTGSGVLAICVAKHAAVAKTTATDISDAALEIAKRNAKRHDVLDRIQFLQSDLLTAIDPELKFDFVVSNPPYVGQMDYDSLSPTVRDFEPKQALLAGEQGTEVIARLVEQAAHRLNPNGWLLFETCPQIIEPSCQLVRDAGAFTEPEVVKDLANLPRLVCARLA